MDNYPPKRTHPFSIATLLPHLFPPSPKRLHLADDLNTQQSENSIEGGVELCLNAMYPKIKSNDKHTADDRECKKTPYIIHDKCLIKVFVFYRLQISLPLIGSDR